MSFKKGIFALEAPIRIFGVEYISNLSVQFNLLNELEVILLMLSQFRLKIILHEFPYFDPQYVTLCFYKKDLVAKIFQNPRMIFYHFIKYHKVIYNWLLWLEICDVEI